MKIEFVKLHLMKEAPLDFHHLNQPVLLDRISGEAVAAGKVGDGVARAVVSIEAVVLLHGLAGPVAHMLPGAGQGVIDGGFAGVRLAQKGDRVFHTDSTSILSASARLMAISVSRR